MPSVFDSLTVAKGRLTGATKVSVDAAGTAAAEVAAHEAAADPHPQYLTQAEADAAYSALGHGHAIADVTGLQTALDGKQPLDATLTSFAGLTIAANTLTIGTGTDAFSQTAFAANTFPARASSGSLAAKAITDFGLSLVDDATAAAARTTLGGTTVGQAFFTAANPSAVRFARVNADNTVSLLSDSDFRTAIGAGVVPAGTIAAYGGGSLPTGWLECDGSAVSRTTYADLFAAIGTSWPGGDGSTTFGLPDLRGRAVIGHGTGTGLSNRLLGSQAIGAETHTLTTAEIPSHEHAPGDTATSFIVAGINTAPVGTGASNWGTRTTTASAGGGGSHNNMQPSAVARWIIKT